MEVDKLKVDVGHACSCSVIFFSQHPFFRANSIVVCRPRFSKQFPALTSMNYFTEKPPSTTLNLRNESAPLSNEKQVVLLYIKYTNSSSLTLKLTGN